MLCSREYRWMRIRHGVLRAKEQMNEPHNAEHLLMLTARYGWSFLTRRYMQVVADRKQKLLSDMLVDTAEAILTLLLDKTAPKG